MKNSILFLLAMIFGMNIYAKHVELSVAKKVAERYYCNVSQKNAVKAKLSHTESANAKEIYYVFNCDNEGFVIIAADDASLPVLGYSLTTQYQKTGHPVQFDYLLKNYKNQIMYIQKKNLKATSEIEDQWNALKNNSFQLMNSSKTAVSPLLTTTWAQSPYFNALCPGGSVAGCAATAMAQILKYWNYPATGIGSHTYYHSTYGYLTANFGSTTYNYSNMPNAVTSSNSAVATLNYHCGVAVDMNYSPSGSGAYVLTSDFSGFHSASCQNAYTTFFGFNASLQGIEKSNYTDVNWINLLKQDLSGGKPVQYAGWDNTLNVAHTWVFDGVDISNNFHANFGWGGSYNGYYNIYSLNPSTYQFTANQQAIIGIQPSIMTPSNDNCNGAIILTSNTSCQSTYSTVDGATADNFNVPSCDTYSPQSGILGAGVFFKFTAVATSHTIKVVPTGTLDVIVVAYSGGCYVLQEIGCMDTPGGNGVTTILTLNNLTIGQQYTIRVYDYGSANATSGGFNICVTHTTPQYTISTSANPSAGGYASGGGTYQSGQSCTVTATPYNGYGSPNWTENGSVVSTNSSYTFTVTGNRSLVANFIANPISFNITTSSNPSAGGYTSGGGSYQSGQNSTVTAIANSGFTFSNWTENGSIVSSNSSYSFNVTGNRNLVANFTANPINYTISTSSNPSSGGYTSGGGSYQNGQSCTVISTANSGYSNNNWTENGSVVSSSTSYTFTVTGNRNLMANFIANPVNFIVSTSAFPSNGGYISGGGTYPNGQSCTVTATSYSGYTFTNWTENGSIISTNPSYSFTVSGNRSLVANFTANPVYYTIILNTNPVNAGLAFGGGQYQSGENCIASETSSPNYTFLYWTEGSIIYSNTTTYVFTVNSNRTLTANYALNTSIQNEENETVKIQVFPNPNDGVFSINICSGECYLYIHDIVGRLIYHDYFEQTDNPINIDLSNYKKGIYLLTLKSGFNTYNEKLLIH